MKQLQRDIQTHRFAVALYLALWLALCVFTVTTWLFDPDGYSVGMGMPVTFVHLASPFIVTTTVVWWQTGLVAGLKRGMLVGALFAAANMGVLILWSGALIMLGRVNPESATMPWWEGVIEALHLGLTYVLIGLILGGVGGLLGALVSITFHRERGGSCPVAPTAMQ